MRDMNHKLGRGRGRRRPVEDSRGGYVHRGTVARRRATARRARPRRRRARLNLRAPRAVGAPAVAGSFSRGDLGGRAPATQRPGIRRARRRPAARRRPRQTRGRAPRAAPRPAGHPAPQIPRRRSPRRRPEMAHPSRLDRDGRRRDDVDGAGSDAHRAGREKGGDHARARVLRRRRGRTKREPRKPGRGSRAAPLEVARQRRDEHLDHADPPRRVGPRGQDPTPAPPRPIGKRPLRRRPRTAHGSRQPRVAAVQLARHSRGRRVGSSIRQDRVHAGRGVHRGPRRAQRAAVPAEAQRARGVRVVPGVTRGASRSRGRGTGWPILALGQQVGECRSRRHGGADGVPRGSRSADQLARHAAGVRPATRPMGRPTAGDDVRAVEVAAHAAAGQGGGLGRGKRQVARRVRRPAG